MTEEKVVYEAGCGRDEGGVAVAILSTTEAADLLTAQRREADPAAGVVTAETVKRWCGEGRFLGARKIGEGLRGVWAIPIWAVTGFEWPKVGRPAKAE